MKISPQKYAIALADVMQTTAHQSQAVHSFLDLLRRRKEMRKLSKILAAFEREWRSRNNLVHARIQYPEKFKNTVKLLHENLEKKSGKTLEFLEVPDSEMIGGFRVKIEDTLIDGSLSSMLKRFQGAIARS